MGIKTKILLLTIASLILVLSISTYYNERIIGQNAENDLRGEVIKIVKQIDSGAVTGNYPTELSVLNENLAELIGVRQNIVRIDLYTFDGAALKPWTSVLNGKAARTGLTPDEIARVRQGLRLLNEEKIDGRRYVNIIAPIHYKNDVFGLTEVKISREDLDALLRKQHRQAFIIAIIAVIMITAILVVSINRMIYNPVQKILSVISKVKEGDLTAEAVPMANDELGRLTQSFNGMIQTIRKNTAEKEFFLKRINSFNEELQYKVRLSTQELQKKNEELRNAIQFIYKMQKQLGHTRKLAAVGQLAATLAHELGTPLHSISGHLQLLQEESGLSNEAQRRLAIMHSQLERVIGSIHHTLDNTRPADAKFDWVDLNMLLDEMETLVLPETMSRQISMEKDFQKDLPAVYGSSSQLQDVFLNLIDNAIDACKQGGSISILTRCVNAPGVSRYPGEEADAARWVQVTITDNGHGIPHEEVEHIFEPFYTTKAHGQGTGLGLAISQDIIGRHSGTITVESRINEGSRFTVLLPLKEGVHVENSVNTCR